MAPPVFSVLGLLLLVLGAVMFRNDRRRIRNGQRADAEVVGMRESQRGNGRPSYYPVVRFRTADGRDVEAATKMAGDPPAARRGDRVQVIYQPGGGDVIIDNFKGRGLLSVSVLSVVGLALVALGMSFMAPHSGRGPAPGMFAVGFFVGVALLAAGVVVFCQDRRLAGHGRRAGAEVVDLAREPSFGDHGSPWVYYPVVRFHTEDGQEVVARTRSGGNPPPARPGDQVRVRYEIGYPENVAIDTAMGRGLVVGVIAVVAGLGMLAYTISHMGR